MQHVDTVNGRNRISVINRLSGLNGGELNCGYRVSSVAGARGIRSNSAGPFLWRPRLPLFGAAVRCPRF